MIDALPAVDGSQTVGGSQVKTTDSTQEAVKTYLDVGAQAAVVMIEKSSHATKTEKKVKNVRVLKRKRIPMKS